jgi:hypothetical protein
MFGKLTPEEIVELREEQMRRDALNKKQKFVQPRYQQPRVVARKTYMPKGMIGDFLGQCKPITCGVLPKKKGRK